MDVAQYLRLFLSLSFLFGILYIGLKLSSKWQRKRYSGDITIVDRLGVDSGVSVLLIKVKDKEYLIGVGGKELHLITEINHVS